jgi:RHS repeat-associated protein
LNYWYAYDAENRMVTFNDGTNSHYYAYDGNDLRIKKVSGSNTTVYYYNGTDLAGEYLNGSLSREFIHGPQGKVAKIVGSSIIYPGEDHLSKRFATDASGSIISGSQQGQYPFGEQWYGTTSDREQFTTYEHDAESGNDYAVFRSYESRIGRFTSPDPYDGSMDLFNPQSMNRYAYVTNDPIDWNDPLGLDGPCDPQDFSPASCADLMQNRWWRQFKRLRMQRLDGKGQRNTPQETNQGPKLTPAQCAAVRVLLQREEDMGTTMAAYVSSLSSYGDKTVDVFNSSVSGRAYTETAVGLIKVDWFTELRKSSLIPGPQIPAYIVGKMVWTLNRKAVGAPITHPWPYQDPIEARTVNKALLGAGYRTLFPPDYMKENCGQ